MSLGDDVVTEVADVEDALFPAAASPPTATDEIARAFKKRPIDQQMLADSDNTRSISPSRPVCVLTTFEGQPSFIQAADRPTATDS